MVKLRLLLNYILSFSREVILVFGDLYEVSLGLI